MERSSDSLKISFSEKETQHMKRIHWKKLFPDYGFAVLACLSALLVTKQIKPVSETVFFELFQGAVVLTAWYGGMGPGILAGIFSFFIIDYYFIAPLNAFAFNLQEEWGFVVFGVVAILTGSLSGKLKWAKTELENHVEELKKAKSDLESAQAELEIRIQQRTDQLFQSNKNLTHEIGQRMEAEKAMMEISNREQRRLGQDLHDGLIQVITGTRLIVEDLKKKLMAEQHSLSEDVETVESCLSDALAQADSISRGLYPVELETHGLMAALEELANKTSRLYPVSCLFICRNPVLIKDPATATHLYRIVQEAVSNAIKGGKAKRINIRFFERNGRIFLSVADNGVGFQKGRVRNGMGLKIMNHRSKLINADLRFIGRPHGGTLVRCAFYPAKAEEYKDEI